MSPTTRKIRVSQSPNYLQGRLLVIAAVFLGLYAAALSIAPAARARSWQVDYRYNHWLGFVVWVVILFLADRQTRRHLPERDPYLLPLAGLLSGWGLMTIWRLFPDFGYRQTMWLVIALVVFTLGLRLPTDLKFLRRYKYVLLTGGLILTALTLFFGTNPASEIGPRLWLGCCGVYLQPSEPLKLLLVIYLSAYLSDKQPWVSWSSRAGSEDNKIQNGKDGDQNGPQPSSLPLLAPILLMTGLTVLLLLVQRDLGTATIFLFLFAVIVYLATERKIVLISSAILLLAAGISGYFMFDVVRLRIDAWLNPWLDPSDRSYQIVQSIIAMANGGVGGRGPGMGSPTLVPISHSDFIFSAIIEEGGMIAAIALIALLMMLTAAGVRIAMRAPDNFRRLLAAGLTAYLIGQSLLIIGGNIRLLPLTGVTLPFVSYGGSSLVTAFISLLLLILISQSGNESPTLPRNPRLFTRLGYLLLVCLGAVALVVGWWTYFRGPDLLERTDNARRSIADRQVRRGEILDRENNPLASTEGVPGDYWRAYNFPALGSTVGYSHPLYGQSGLEADLDPYLRGLLGPSEFEVWWNHLLYGQPPPGVDIRLSLDMDLQGTADELLGDHTGALILLNAENGEVLAVASHPTFDPNQLEDIWPALVSSPESPLVNRAFQGRYRPGAILGPFLLAAFNEQGDLTYLDGNQSYESLFANLDCAIAPAGTSWAAPIAAGCTLPEDLSKQLDAIDTQDFYAELGLFEFPDPTQFDKQGSDVQGSTSSGELLGDQPDFLVSPLQVVLAAATLSSDGALPAAQIITAANLPETGWSVFPPEREERQVFSQDNADFIANSLATEGLPVWSSVASTLNEDDRTITWYLAGSLPNWTGTPVALLVLLEEDDPLLAMEIGQNMIAAAMQYESTPEGY